MLQAELPFLKDPSGELYEENAKPVPRREKHRREQVDEDSAYGLPGGVPLPPVKNHGHSPGPDAQHRPSSMAKVSDSRNQLVRDFRKAKAVHLQCAVSLSIASCICC